MRERVAYQLFPNKYIPASISREFLPFQLENIEEKKRSLTYFVFLHMFLWHFRIGSLGNFSLSLRHYRQSHLVTKSRKLRRESIGERRINDESRLWVKPQSLAIKS